MQTLLKHIEYQHDVDLAELSEESDQPSPHYKAVLTRNMEFIDPYPYYLQKASEADFVKGKFISVTLLVLNQIIRLRLTFEFYSFWS